jgi:hypothetical protein
MSAELLCDPMEHIGKACAVAECRDVSAAALEHQPLCLEHFFLRCYQALQCYDGSRDERQEAREEERAQLRRFLDECSTQALKISLRNDNLNNLQRSRLLDVLLWAGELSERAGAHRNWLNSGAKDARGKVSRSLTAG